MQVKEKSFFQTTAGVVTGVAGILTAVVGLLTLSAQQGWLSSKSSSTPAATTGTTLNPNLPSTSVGSLGTPTTSVGSATTAGSGNSGAGGGAGTSAAQFTVDPPAITFENLGPRDQQVTITNTGTSSISFLLPAITGTNSNAFTVSDQTCGSGVDAGRTCQLKVSFAPPGVGTFTATMLVKPTSGPNRVVPLKGTSIL
jgi:hypothetical protein